MTTQEKQSEVVTALGNLLNVLAQRTPSDITDDEAKVLERAEIAHANATGRMPFRTMELAHSTA